MDFWAFGMHIFLKCYDFIILTPLGANSELIWDIVSPIWPMGQIRKQLDTLVANAKGLYPFILHFGGFLGIGEAYLFKYLRFCKFDPT